MTLINTLTRSLGIVSLLCLLPASAKPEPAAAYTLGSEAIGYYPHYGWQTPNGGDFQGFARDLFDEFARQAGLQLHYEMLPVKRLYQQFLSDQDLDFKYPDAPEWQQQRRGKQTIHYSDTVTFYVDGVITRTDRPPQAPLKRLGTIRGFTPVPFTTAIAQKRIQLLEYSRVVDLLQAVLHRRIDGAYVNVDVALFQAKYSLAVESLLCFNSELPYIHDGYRLSSIKHPELIAAFNEFLQERHLWVAQLKSTYGLYNTVAHRAPLAELVLASRFQCTSQAGASVRP